MKRFIFSCFICMVLIGCSTEKSSPSINQSADAAESKDVTVTEKEPPKPKEIILFLEGNEKRFNVKDLPLIHKYVQTSPDPDLAMARMRINEIETPLEETSLYILRYACEAKLCSNILIKETKNEVQTRLVSDLSLFKTASISPDQEKLLLTFLVNEGDTITREKVNMIDLDNLETLSLLQSEGQIDLNFVWPILDATWKTDESIEVSIPKLDNSSLEALKNWYSLKPEDQEKKTIALTIDD
ncbi:hypothetical protein [Pontibacillus marinus]|uniref:Lipoprotein n=1 Tax=Pontibacillus marinus BH030004 = DSM 16465 TaxID=1385511 RepID=A0A0A5FTS6_9BACI|nr:hypothetical protein [Pontibacillus marinus]KGX84176.1 hypothetical protein N783_18710 [Pontibacillus marinus BH030004 = DSM 16465]